MGHRNSEIHDRYYQNQVLDTDIVSAFLDTPSDEALMKLMGHMSLTRDPSAPSKPSLAQYDQARNDAEVVASKLNLQKITNEFLRCHGAITAARRKAKESPDIARAVKALDQQRRDHDKIHKRKLSDLFEVSRQEYFATLGATCLEIQHTGGEESIGPTKPEYRFTERAELTTLLFPAVRSQPVSYSEQVHMSCEIIRNYESLCHRREYRRPPVKRAKSNTVDEPVDVKPCFLDTEPDIYPMQCPGTQCLFCLGDTTLCVEIRTRCFSKPFTLTRHVQTQHLQYLPKGKPFICPHPSCALDSVQLQHADHFKSHALQAHSVAHCV